MSTQEFAFLKEIVARPEEDEPRLVYADWLSEQGNPRGDYIRLSVDAATRPIWDPVRAELEAQADLILRQHRADWCRELRKITSAIYFDRGFVDRITLKATRFSKAAEYFEHLPLRDLGLTGKRNEVGGVYDAPFLSRLRGLRFRSQTIGAKRFEKFFASPHCKQLQLLDLHATDATNEIVCSALSQLPYLETLELTSNDISQSPEIADLGVKLRHLRLPDSWFGWRVQTTLINPTDFPALEKIGNWGSKRLIFDAPDGTLREIEDVSYESARQLYEARGQTVPPLRVAIRPSPKKYDEFAKWLRRTNSRLSILKVQHWRDEGQSALTPHLADLHSLAIVSAEQTWCEELFQAAAVPQQLRVLNLGDQFDGRTLARYLRSEAASHLVRLRICQHYAFEHGEEITAALLDSQHLGRLTHLLLTSEGQQRRNLTARFGRHVCQFTGHREIYPPRLPASC